MNREKLAQMERAIAADYGNIAGVTVLRDGGTVYESYFGDCTDKSRIHVFSVTKSVVSILFGIALDRGYLDGGIWAEAARAVRDWAFAHTPFQILYSYMKKDNIPSSAAARANGMRLTDEFTDAEGKQTAVYSVSRAEWEGLDAPLIGGNE